MWSSCSKAWLVSGLAAAALLLAGYGTLVQPETEAGVPPGQAFPSGMAQAEAATWRAFAMGGAHGQLEPCGCSGGQLGGIERAATRMASGSSADPTLRVITGNTLSAEAGGLHDWAWSQIETIYSAYGLMRLTAVGLGTQDLALSIEELRSAAVLLGSAPLLATNLVDDEGNPPFATHVVDAQSGAAVLCFLPENLSGPGWHTLSHAAAIARLRAEAPGLDFASNRALVLLEGDQHSAQALASEFAPAGAFFLCFGPKLDCDQQAQPLSDGASAWAFAGSRLRYVLELTAKTEGGFGLEAHAVDPNTPLAAELEPFREQYRQALALTDVVAQLGDARGVHPRGRFVGSEACQSCHEGAYAVWKETYHFSAIHTLESDLRGAAPATLDPRCIECHTVGYGYETGWASQHTAQALRRGSQQGLAGVGCEACHGPGAEHVLSSLPKDILSSSEARCTECHDSENDPNWKFARKWPLVEHED